MHLVDAASTRRTETPNGVMRTLASPTLGGTAALALWTVEMQPGQRGPEHAFDGEQVLSVLDGAALLDLGGEVGRLAAGDTAVLPAGVPRRFGCDGSRPLRAVLAGVAGAHALLPDGTDRGVPP